MDSLSASSSLEPTSRNRPVSWFFFFFFPNTLRGLTPANKCLNDLSAGDIKSENVMVTSWNWIFLTDLAPFKPTHLPEDNPADFNFFFQSARPRATCYLAPERFYREVQTLFSRDFFLLQTKRTHFPHVRPTSVATLASHLPWTCFLSAA